MYAPPQVAFVGLTEEQERAYRVLDPRDVSPLVDRELRPERGWGIGVGELHEIRQEGPRHVLRGREVPPREKHPRRIREGIIASTCLSTNAAVATL